jgi:ubiquinone/menaquinone biosynthesis C-methylase UbiE
VRLRDATTLLADAGLAALGPTTWADLGCGTGTFTLALAELLAAGSSIHAMDHDASSLRNIPATHDGVSIKTYCGDFTDHTWPFSGLDGILMANSLHYVENQPAFIRGCRPRMTPSGRFLIVEYDTATPSAWVPWPLPQTRLSELFSAEGYSSMRMLGSRPSIYRRAAIYAALITGQGRASAGSAERQA